MINPILRDFLEFAKYKEILDDACYHYTKRLKKLPTIEKFKDSIPNSLATWISNGSLHNELTELEDIDAQDSTTLINKIGNNEILIKHIKDAISVYYNDYNSSKEKLHEELGLIPYIRADDYEKNLKEVYEKSHDL